MKTLLKLNETLKNLDGKELLDNFEKPVPIKLLLAQTIRRGSTVDQQGGRRFDVMRADLIAHDIYNSKGKIELEDSDYEMVKYIIETDITLNIMSKAACLKTLLVKEDK